MSAPEVLKIIKAINGHVTVKYGAVINDFITEKTNAHLVFQRAFFTEMDKAVQTLVQDITNSIKNNIFHTLSHGELGEILNKIQTRCDKYSKWRQNAYVKHIKEIEQFEKIFNKNIQNTLNQKLTEQNILFDAALSYPLHKNNINHNTNATQTQIQKNNHNITSNTPSFMNSTLSHQTSSPNTSVSTSSQPQSQPISNNNNSRNTTNSLLNHWSPPVSTPSNGHNTVSHGGHHFNFFNKTSLSTSATASLPNFLQQKRNMNVNGNKMSNGKHKLNISTKKLPIATLDFDKLHSILSKIKVNNHPSLHIPSRSKMRNIVPPPKPPPPTSDDDCHHCAECNQDFVEEKDWKKHLLTHSQKKKNKKRKFNKISDDNNGILSKKPNKRRRRKHHKQKKHERE